MMLGLGMSLSNGVDWLTYFQVPDEGMGVLYVQTEIPQNMLKARARTLAKATGQPLGLKTDGKLPWEERVHLWTEHFLKLDQDKGFGLLVQHVQALKPAVIILDPLYKLLSGNFLKVDVASPFLDRMDALIENTGASVIIVAHPRKGEPDEYSADDLMGSSLFADWADTVISVAKKGGDAQHDKLMLEFKKARHAIGLLDDVEVSIDRYSLDMRGCKYSIAKEQKK